VHYFKQSIQLTVILLLVTFVLLLSSTGFAKQNFDVSKLEFIDNGTIKLGISLDLGGAITYISNSKDGKNIINNWDWGRQIQMSFFAYPVPYTENGQEPKDHWKHIGWNPIQAGDDFGNGSKVTAFKKTEISIYVKCIPMQWPLNNVAGECTYECWIGLKGNTVQVKARLNNARSDKTKYKAKHQELPAVYTNGEYYRLMTYKGTKPFTDDKISRIPKKTSLGFPWDYWLATENWAASVNDHDWGLGIYKPNNSLFIGGFAGKEGKGDTTDSPTGYIAPLQTEILDHNIVYTYNYSLILGSLKEIREYAVEQGKNSITPDWTFEKDRQHWSYHAAKNQGVDAGWPIQGFIELNLSKQGMTAVSPPTVWQAKDAPKLYIEAAFKTEQKKSIVAWTPYDGSNHNPMHTEKNSTQFDINGDGSFRTYSIHLSKVSSYKGALSYLMLRPILQPEKDAWVKIKRIWFGKK
jgi:hypothetical protein